MPSVSLKTGEGDWHAHPLTRCTLLSLAPARAAASPDAELSSWLAPWAPPAGRGGGGGGVAPVGGGGTGGGGGGGGPLQERVALAADEGCPGGRMGPEMQRRGVSFQHLAGVQSTVFISGSWRRMKSSLLLREMRNRTVYISGRPYRTWLCYSHSLFQFLQHLGPG